MQPLIRNPSIYLRNFCYKLSMRLGDDMKEGKTTNKERSFWHQCGFPASSAIVWRKWDSYIHFVREKKAFETEVWQYYFGQQ